MNKNIYTSTLLFIAMIWSSVGFTQVAEWIDGSGGLGSEVCMDPFSNSFTCGQFVGTVDIGGNSYTTVGTQDVAVVKRSPSGQVIWTTVFGGTQSDYAYEIVYDGLGNVWVTGSFNGTMNVGSFTLVSAGGADAYVVKIDASNGNILDAKRGGGTNNDYGLGIKSNGMGDVYVVGNFIGSFTYGTLSLSGPSYEVFLMKLNGTNSVDWGKKISGSSIETVWNLALDPLENIYLAGYSSSASTDYGGTVVTMSTNNHFIAKFDNLGQNIWVAQSAYNGETNGLCVDANGNAYFTGNFDTQADFDAIHLTGGSNDDIIVGKVNNDGTYAWVNAIGGSGSDQGYDIECNDLGDVFLVGSFEGSFTFGSTNLSAGGFSKSYVSKINPDGTVNWVLQSSGASTSHFSFGVALNNFDEMYVTGSGGTIYNFGGLSSPITSGYLVKIANNANIIQGTVFNDVNSNGLLDTLETGIPNVVLQLNNNPYINSSNNSGLYELYTLPGAQSVSIPNIPLYYTLTTPAILSSNFTGMGNIDLGKDFGLLPTPNMNDLWVDITNVTNPKAGHVLAYMITYKNLGTTTQNATVSLQGDAAIAYLSASPAPSSQNGQSVNWNLGSLLPQTTGTLHVQFNIPGSMSIGTPVVATASITPVSSDMTPVNNTQSITNLVTGPYDPNYKEVDIDTLNDVSNPGYLVYTIHFQNIGNDDANTVIIKDTMSSYLDLASMEYVSSSHQPMNWRFIDGNIAEFRFENINLPAESIDPVGSCGFVKYKVKYLSTLPLNESIYNFADIYFDYNAPIRTNTAQTIYYKNTASINELQNNAMVLFPNPVSEDLTLSFNDASELKGSIRILDISGKVIRIQNITNQSTNKSIKIAMNGLDSGIYLIELYNGNQVFRNKIVKE